MQTRVRPLWGLPPATPPARGSSRMLFSAAVWMLAARPTFLRLRVPKLVLSVCTITPAWQAGSVGGSCIYMRRYTMLASLFLTFPVWSSLGSSASLQPTQLHSLTAQRCSMLCMHTTSFIAHPSGAPRVLPGPGHWKQGCNEHWAQRSFELWFSRVYAQS